MTTRAHTQRQCGQDLLGTKRPAEEFFSSEVVEDKQRVF